MLTTLPGIMATSTSVIRCGVPYAYFDIVGDEARECRMRSVVAQSRNNVRRVTTPRWPYKPRPLQHSASIGILCCSTMDLARGYP